MRTTTKSVKTAIREHVLESFGTDYGWDNDNEIENLKQQLKSFDYLPTTYKMAEELVQGGTFLVYYHDVQEFLDGLGINTEGKEYTQQQSWDLYKHLIAREISALVA